MTLLLIFSTENFNYFVLPKSKTKITKEVFYYEHYWSATVRLSPEWFCDDQITLRLGNSSRNSWLRQTTIGQNAQLSLTMICLVPVHLSKMNFRQVNCNKTKWHRWPCCFHSNFKKRRDSFTLEFYVPVSCWFCWW